jgi:hypothetical protein
MDYLSVKFAAAKKLKDTTKAQELARAMNNHMLMARRIQEISCHATCDSATSLASDPDGGPQPSKRTVILLAPQIQ